MLMGNFFNYALKYAIILVHIVVLYSCDQGSLRHTTSNSQETNEEWKSAAIKGVESIYFTSPNEVNSEIMTLLNYGNGNRDEGEIEMRKAYKRMKKEIEESKQVAGEGNKLGNQPYNICAFETEDRSDERRGRCIYQFYFTLNQECVGFVRYFNNYNSLNNSISKRIAQNESYKDISYSNFGYVDLLAVKEPMRKHGVAQKLMNRCEDDLRNKGKKFCVLYTFDENRVNGYTTAHKFYKKLQYGNGLAGNLINGNKTTYMVKRL
jgi:ribosomal protein S18 acetylase RimI-like enzyme